MSASNDRPEWADCSYVDGSLSQHWVTVGHVRGEDQSGDCFVDVVEYHYGDGEPVGPNVRVGGIVMRPEVAASLARLIAAALQVIGRE